VKRKQTEGKDTSHLGWLAGLSDSRPSNALFSVQFKPPT